MPSSQAVNYPSGISNDGGSNPKLTFGNDNYLITATGGVNGIFNNGTIQFGDGNNNVTTTGSNDGIFNNYATIQLGKKAEFLGWWKLPQMFGWH